MITKGVTFIKEPTSFSRKGHTFLGFINPTFVFLLHVELFRTDPFINEYENTHVTSFTYVSIQTCTYIKTYQTISYN